MVGTDGALGVEQLATREGGSICRSSPSGPCALLYAPSFSCYCYSTLLWPRLLLMLLLLMLLICMLIIVFYCCWGLPSFDGLAAGNAELEEGEAPVPRYRPDGLDALCKATGFSRKELQLMYRSFKQVRVFYYFFIREIRNIHFFIVLIHSFSAIKFT